MTTELEQEFYDTFGIEEKENLNYTEKGFIEHIYNYPEITAEKLLEIICILNNYGKYDCWGVTIARLKKAILENCIVVVISKSLNNVILEQFKQRIQQLFKE